MTVIPQRASSRAREREKAMTPALAAAIAEAVADDQGTGNLLVGHQPQHLVGRGGRRERPDAEGVEEIGDRADADREW